VNVRRAADGDLPRIHALFEAFAAERPPPSWQPVDWNEERREIDEIVRTGVAFVADRDRETVGFALSRRRGPDLAVLSDVYVVPASRRQGVARALVRAVASAWREQGVSHVTLEVDTDNAAARGAYARFGFRDHMLTLVAETAAVEARLATAEAGGSFGSIHVQTDDEPAVERAVREFVPRLPGRSRGSIVAPPRNGWVAVYDDVCDRDPRQLRRLAHELSARTGAVVLALGVEADAVVRFLLLERGSVVDEYLSVQEYYGPLPPGDVIALAANPRVVARLTGADPARVRAVARHAASPAELPPPGELLAEIAGAVGVEGGHHGWSDAPDIPGAHRIDR
jgi:ribosomal protein S18 acetylase RimI-like enzyme